MATTMLSARTCAERALQEANVFYISGTEYRVTTAGEEVKTMADHAQQRQGYMTRWKASGDLAFGRAHSEDRPARHDICRGSNVGDDALKPDKGHSTGRPGDGVVRDCKIGRHITGVT